VIQVLIFHAQSKLHTDVYVIRSEESLVCRIYQLHRLHEKDVYENKLCDRHPRSPMYCGSSLECQSSITLVI
jgi:hypothetical protein